jgi:hypothetical protein
MILSWYLIQAATEEGWLKGSAISHAERGSHLRGGFATRSVCRARQEGGRHALSGRAA